MSFYSDKISDMTYCSIFPNVDKQFSCHYCVFILAKPKEIKSARLVMTAILVTFLILASAIITPSSSYLIGSANAQVDPNGDNDGDGLINSWETNGIPYTGVDGQQHFYQLPGANPNHKNLYVEVDYMQFHRPIGGNTNVNSALNDVRRAFSLAPVSNPDGATGITLFTQVDDQIPHQNTTDLDDLINNIKPAWFGTATERADPNNETLLAAKRMAFHYAVFAHDQSGDSAGSSGLAETPGMDFLVTLGNEGTPEEPGWTIDPGTNHNVGTRSEQAGTFMHELGHNLGLEHGGGDQTNCKTNYFSVMNYLFQFPGLVASRPLDYSRSALATLNKANLTEPNGISQSTPPGLNTTYGPRGPGLGPALTRAGVPVDWNFNGRSTDTGVNADINGGLDCRSPGPGPTLTGFNDWNALKYIVPQQALAVQAFEVPKEENISAVDQSRLILLEGIDNAIQRLIKSDPQAMMHKPTGIFDTTHIGQLLKTDQLEAAITELNKLQAKVISVFGQEAAEREVVPQIQNLISVLKQEEPSSSSTPPPPPPPPPSHHDRIKDRINEVLDRHIAVGGAHGEAAQKIKDRLIDGGSDRHR